MLTRRGKQWVQTRLPLTFQPIRARRPFLPYGVGYDLRINHIGRRDGREKGVKGVCPRDK